MRKITLALLFVSALAAAPVMAQSADDLDRQNRVQQILDSSAPVHNMLVACQRTDTADRVVRYLFTLVEPHVNYENEWEIVDNMWARSRRNALARQPGLIEQLAQNPRGATCNDVERQALAVIGEGV